MAMSGMAMDGNGAMTSGTESITSDTCHLHQTGLALKGLDLNNTPYMIMGGKSAGMDMNGADASAAAGFNVTKPNWNYTGPALPQAEAQQLLADGNNGPNDIAMAENGCAPKLTAAEDLGAVQYVQATSEAASHYPTPAAATAAGYQAASPTDYPVVAYVNPTIVAANAAAKRTLNPGLHRRVALRRDAVGNRGAGGSLLHPALDRLEPAHALRRAGAMAPPPRRVRERLELAHHAARHHGLPAVRQRHDR